MLPKKKLSRTVQTLFILVEEKKSLIIFSFYLRNPIIKQKCYLQNGLEDSSFGKRHLQAKMV